MRTRPGYVGRRCTPDFTNAVTFQPTRTWRDTPEPEYELEHWASESPDAAALTSSTVELIRDEREEQDRWSSWWYLNMTA